jgi:hypothetical protein
MDITIRLPDVAALATAIERLAASNTGGTPVQAAVAAAPVASTPAVQAQPEPAATPAPAPTPVATPAPAASSDAIDGPTLKARILNACRGNSAFAAEMEAAFKNAGFEGFDRVPPAQYGGLLQAAQAIGAKHGVTV